MTRSELLAKQLRVSYLMERDGDFETPWEEMDQSLKDYWLRIANRLEVAMARDSYYICRLL